MQMKSRSTAKDMAWPSDDQLFLLLDDRMVSFLSLSSLSLPPVLLTSMTLLQELIDVPTLGQEDLTPSISVIYRGTRCERLAVDAASRTVHLATPTRIYGLDYRTNLRQTSEVRSHPDTLPGWRRLSLTRPADPLHGAIENPVSAPRGSQTSALAHARQRAWGRFVGFAHDRGHLR